MRKIAYEVRSGIIQRYLQGVPRDAMAKDLSISSSTASVAWGEFLAIARAYGVESEVIELRELARILKKVHVTPAESKEGAIFKGLLKSLGVEDEEELKIFVAGLKGPVRNCITIPRE